MSKNILFLITALAIFAILGTGYQYKKQDPTTSSFRKNISFNHLYIVVDDSTYQHLFNHPAFWKRFARVQEQTTTAGSASWPAKYVFGANNYVEFLKPGGLKGRRHGDVGLGFITNRLGTLDSVRHHWDKTLDSVHVEHATTSDGVKSWPWFSSVSIPRPADQQVSAWVFENDREEMTFAGFTAPELTKEIEFADYLRHVAAKMRNIPVDSVKYDRLFDRITAVDILVNRRELAYLKHTLLDIGFTEQKESFAKNGFTIRYSVRNLSKFSLASIHFSLTCNVRKEELKFDKIRLTLNKRYAVMKFNN